MSTPRLLIFDLDGTALGGHEPYAQFPDPFCRMLDRLSDMGVAWSTATTWDVRAQWQVIQASSVRSRPALLVGQTSRQAGRVEAGTLVIDDLHGMAVAEQDARFRQEVWPAVRKAFRELLDRDLVDRIAFDSVQPQCLVEVSARPGREAIVAKLLEPLLADGLYYAWDALAGRHVTLLPCHMTKANSVRLIHARTGIGPDATVIAGDGVNDLPMFDPEFAKWLICPANACDRIKERVRAAGGIVAAAECSWGVVEGLEQIYGLE